MKCRVILLPYTRFDSFDYMHDLENVFFFDDIKQNKMFMLTYVALKVRQYLFFSGRFTNVEYIEYKVAFLQKHTNIPP